MALRWPWLVFAAVGLGAMSTKRQQPDRAQRERMIALIRRIATELGIAPAVALAFAEVESNFNPAARGDMQWAERKPELYRKLVVEKLATNPYRHDPSVWHSYGLYQLLAPYHVQLSEHPHILLDPEVNARRGIAYLARLQRQTGGDVAAMRLAYIGCGADGKRCSEAVTTAALERFAPIYQRWSEGRA